LSPTPSVADRERSLAERWLEDESLHGDLDDQTWQPIQDWLLAVATRVATATAGQDDAAAQALLDRAHAVGTAPSPRPLARTSRPPTSAVTSSHCTGRCNRPSWSVTALPVSTRRYARLWLS
jgi:hypothetical protein